ncbi:uncharacterized protein LOC133788827 isoform X2 [Humulus lupulus]|uniref:uncharacterized protein LOC133788827 isoform X2 n=1 Tax=Humulus lupulus TaxID=3486 RepID=UPI002B408453|nr:uncharacterized protein LOC133788827 isoform X2 [Humulus lupulus]
MEIASKLPKASPSHKLFHPRASVLVSNFVPISKNTILQQIRGLKIKQRQFKNLGVVFASSEPQTFPNPTIVSDRWLLQPIGDGDSRHIGFKVEMPNAYEIASDEVTVGRVPDKADLVIPVATVSARHARIQKKKENLLVTDLDSTNGTFIGDKRLSPGVVATVYPGNSITFARDDDSGISKQCRGI